MTTRSSTGTQRPWLTKLGLAMATATLVVVLTQEDILQLGIIERLELASIDYRFQTRGPRLNTRETSDVVIVEISEESHKALPAKWPWPRSYYARLIRNLKAAGARVVGLDLIFTGSDIYAQENDEELQSAIRETGIVVLAGKTDIVNPYYEMLSPSENFGNIFFTVDSTIGLVNVLNDADGVHRRYGAFFEEPNTRLRVPTFAFATLNRLFDYPALSTAENFSDEFLFAGRSLPKYDPVSFLINFAGPSGTFPRVKFVDVIDDETFTTTDEAYLGVDINTFSDSETGYLHDGTFRGKIVLVGSTAPEDRDLFPVSMAAGLRKGDNLMYGVEIHANVIESILRWNFLTKQSAATGILAIALFTLVTFLVTSALKASRTRHHFLVELNGFLFTVAEIFIIGVASLLLFVKYNYLLTTISPMIAVIAGYFASTAYHFVVERKQRVLIKTMFSTYVNPSVVDELINNPDKLKLGGERKELSVLFSDIEGFTTISEGMPPERLVGLLNEYLSAMTEVVFRNHGTLDKYEGDAVMAFWGAPIHQEDHALRACTTALQMQEAMAEMRKRWQEEQKPHISIRVGINTGEMVVGNMGSAGKFDYTVIGDSVNIASRLEGANKQYRTGIIVSERTYELVQHAIMGRELDLITVKGRSEPLRIYELLQMRNGPIAPSLEVFVYSYTEGLRLYRRRQWKQARMKFDEALRLRPQDHPSKLHIERTLVYEASPPPEEWNGVFLVTKS